MESILKELREQLNIEESNMFFYCPSCEFKYTFEEAMDYGFSCPGCGNMLQEFDNGELIKDLEGQIRFLKEELKINVPVLFLSSKSTEKDIYRALEAGAVDYVTKPFSLKILLQKTLNLIISTSDV